MGEFSSGRWILGLSIYFFGFFCVVFFIMNAQAEAGVTSDTLSVTDPGFQSVGNIPYAQTGSCTGKPFYLCRSMGIDNDSICDLYLGCYWSNGIFTEPHCAGVFEDSDCGDETDQGNCTLTGCTWTDFTGLGGSTISASSSFDWSSVKDSIGFMTGFNATLGAPSIIQFVISFFFFWLPFFMLLWSIYMAIPFLH